MSLPSLELLAVLGILPSWGALMSGFFVLGRILPKTHRDTYIYAYLFAWALSIAPAMVFSFRRAGPKLGELAYPGYRKNERLMS